MTHEIDLPPATFDAINALEDPTTILHPSLFDDAVTGGDRIRLTTSDGRTRTGRVSNLAVVIHFDPQPPV